MPCGPSLPMRTARALRHVPAQGSGPQYLGRVFCPSQDRPELAPGAGRTVKAAAPLRRPVTKTDGAPAEPGRAPPCVLPCEI